ncbi:MAG TPA: hypothetical protein PLS90_14505 [Candidatus Sumerlaeota bacterium]|nr:MAG: hypothetical protein BWZ08_01141 [candidate division BRC1 bacterium ADurb.BinA292]HOE97787.1 hypothetical protein [Candidatus Sumerlaeota bacterium]HOR29640.1 hypothetical protein [Candidatus Sumerlaeota bacterium]HPK03656.1 hypothetical protein [Candidatus Sumerlaeota bacterium]
MSLTLSLGILADVCDDLEDEASTSAAEDREFLEAYERHLDRINEILTAAGLPEHDEPDFYPDPEGSDDEGPEWSYTLREGELERLLERIRQAITEGDLTADADMTSHLLDHSTTDGCYVPLDFPVLLRKGRLTVGSSHQLLRLMEALAQSLDIPAPPAAAPIDYSERGEELQAWLADRLGRPFGNHIDDPCRRLCLALYQGARLSIKYEMLLTLA